MELDSRVPPDSGQVIDVAVTFDSSQVSDHLQQ